MIMGCVYVWVRRGGRGFSVQGRTRLHEPWKLTSESNDDYGGEDTKRIQPNRASSRCQNNTMNVDACEGGFYQYLQFLRDSVSLSINHHDE